MIHLSRQIHPITYSSSPPLVYLHTPICDLASSEWEWNRMTNMAPVSLYHGHSLVIKTSGRLTKVCLAQLYIPEAAGDIRC